MLCRSNEELDPVGCRIHRNGKGIQGTERALTKKDMGSLGGVMGTPIARSVCVTG